MSETKPPSGLTESHQTMWALLDYPNPEGLHPNEAHWRDFAREMRNALRTERDRLLRACIEAGHYLGHVGGKACADCQCETCDLIREAVSASTTP